MPEQNIAPAHAGVKPIGIKSIKPLGKEPVYNLEVEGYHNFAVNGGIIVHNCPDALRYDVNTCVPKWRYGE